MVFQHGLTGELKAVHLPRRSAVFVTGESRIAWLHGIKFRNYDIVEGEKYNRGTRTSITYRTTRTTPCMCSFPSLCDSQQWKKR
mmetsp:Transcript_13748/g.21348  ORF Transcript_13748/g.21348 Transcript_13748/m.21348 type:complete len:84 (+) Transcript_13748:1190-1441(+)